MRPLEMLDLFSGKGGASQAMIDRGWKVTRIDSEPTFAPTICADLLTWRPALPFACKLLWASPPCDDFSRESMPWCRTGVDPSLALIRATLDLVNLINPDYWILENVRGSRKWLRDLLGPPMMSTGPVFLWGRLPPVLLPVVGPWKERLSSARAAERATMPFSRAIAIAVERANAR